MRDRLSIVGAVRSAFNLWNLSLLRRRKILTAFFAAFSAWATRLRGKETHYVDFFAPDVHKRLQKIKDFLVGADSTSSAEADDEEEEEQRAEPSRASLAEEEEPPLADAAAGSGGEPTADSAAAPAAHAALAQIDASVEVSGGGLAPLAATEVEVVEQAEAKVVEQAQQEEKVEPAEAEASAEQAMAEPEPLPEPAADADREPPPAAPEPAALAAVPAADELNVTVEVPLN